MKDIELYLNKRKKELEKRREFYIDKLKKDLKTQDSKTISENIIVEYSIFLADIEYSIDELNKIIKDLILDEENK